MSHFVFPFRVLLKTHTFYCFGVCWANNGAKHEQQQKRALLFTGHFGSFWLLPAGATKCRLVKPLLAQQSEA